MPPQPIVPTYRLKFPMTCLGLPHVNHFLLGCVASGDVSGFNAVVRAGFVNPGVSAVMTAWWTSIASLFSAADAVFGNATLEQLIGGFYIPQYTENNAVVTTGGLATVKANIFSVQAYSTLHERMKVVFTETIFSGASRFIALPTGNASIDEPLSSLVNYDGAAVNVDPWAWSKSRADDYTGSFISLVATYSKHWRRKRGLG